ncbi:MAG: hypothetical protein R3307_10650, partial [Anaerolineales bacterium]|nr:hypothetical protein [Anaerolineales bacterium]
RAGRIPRWALEGEVLKVLAEYILIPESISAHQEIAIKNQSTAETERAERRSALNEEKAAVARAIVNLTKAIADAGHSDALLDALKQKELTLAQVRTELDGLNTPIQNVPHLTPEQIESASKELIHALNKAPPEKLRQILRGIIHEVIAEKEGKVLRGMVTYYYPPPFDLAPTKMLPMEADPVGAYLHRQLFSHPFEVKIRS